MQKWEYVLISVLRSYGMNYRANGNKVNDWKDMPIHEVFVIMGKQGFEFAAYDGENYIFKRPLVARKKATSDLKDD